jgi:ABC-type antimicrobial peptide transport system permease subunit
MTIFDILRTATRPIRSRTLESALIVFAIALGVGVVTAMLALILNRAEQEKSITESIEAREFSMVARENDYQSYFSPLGVNPLMKLGKVSDKPAKLERVDLQMVLRACPSLQYAYMNDWDSIPEQKTGGSARAKEVRVQAVTQSYIEAGKLTLLAGTWPTSQEFAGNITLVAITERFARERFGQPKKVDATSASGSSKPEENVEETPFDVRDAVNQVITSQFTSDFRVVGVFAPPKRDSVFANDQNKTGAQGIVPWGSTNFGRREVYELKFLAKADQFDAAREQLRTYVDKRFGPAITSKAAIDRITESLNVSRNAALVTIFFASGGMMIAALNITNLMLARVLGRTRSIGISSALGASSRLIFVIFLTESLVLGLIGGLLGLALARGITVGLEYALKGASVYNINSLDLTLQPLHFGLGLLVAFGVSLLFGAYPALMASRIRPSEALRG